MQAPRLLTSVLAAIGVAGLISLAVAQTSTTTTPSAVPNASETDTQRMDRERMDRERMERERVERERMNAPAGAAGSSPRADDSTSMSTSRRDANGNLIARSDRN